MTTVAGGRGAKTDRYGLTAADRRVIIGKVRFTGLPLPALPKILTSAVKQALDELATYWWQNIGPKHFQRAAFGRYGGREPRVYELRSKEYGRAKYRRYGHNDPLVFTGNLRAAFLRGTMKTRFQGAGRNTRVIVSWPNVPQYTYQEANSHSPRKYAELTIMNEEDTKECREVFVKRFNEAMEAAENGG
jgi:hypothetical protein